MRGTIKVMIRVALVGLFALATALAEDATAEVTKATKQRVAVNYGKLPLSFEANQGQTDAQVKFLSRGSGYSLFMTSTEAVLVLSNPEEKPSAVSDQLSAKSLKTHDSKLQTVLRMKLVGANSASRITGLEELPGKSHYLIGNDPAKRRTNVPSYAKVRYENVYPGVDLIYYGNQRQLEYDFVVAPGADPGAIKLAFEGTEKIEVDAQGALLLQTAGGQVRVHKPLVYQIVNGVRKELSGSYVLNPKSKIENRSTAFVPSSGREEARDRSPKLDRVGFQVAAYDRSKPLVIDPVLVYSTYLGGSLGDSGFRIAVDSAGNAYVTGGTDSTNFPTTAGAFDQTFSGGDAFVAKFSFTVPFAAFDAKVELEPDEGEFEVKASFTLGAGSDDINPLTEDVTLKIGTFSITIPAGSFKFHPAKSGKGKGQGASARWTFEGVIDGVSLEAKITDLGGGMFEFKAEGEGANLAGTVNPVNVVLTIGDDSGSTTVTAEFGGEDDDD